MVSGEQSKACCSMPPVQAEYTEPKGTHTTFAGLKTYVVGKEDSKKAVIVIYDVFGFTPQAYQGADLLSTQGFRVYIPDILKGDYANGAMFAGTEEANAKRDAYFSKFPGSFHSQGQPIADLVAEAKKTHAGVGIVGFCWGWKCIVLSSGVKEVDALAGCHPSFAAPDDANVINVPTLLLPSKDEDSSVMQAIYDAAEKKNPGKNSLHQFKDLHHGYMAARSNLSNEDERKGFQEGYTQVADFFNEHL